ncbi:MAG: Hsp70 family protein [Gammaproteobacteria bacterium]|nr:Hsp70 family protein [Gammaproteobacteria bacterium]MDE0367929.1 Hsp70 family protein [Gammaproteobacteria bacterium]
MTLGIGIDFGTTNSTAAVFDGEALKLVALENGNPVMPSATYIDRDLQTRVGQQAIDSYIEGNTGRTVELIPEVIGEQSDFVEQGSPDDPAPLQTSKTLIYGRPLLDSGLRGRLFRGVKRLLGDSGIRRLLVFDHPFRLVALITPLLLHIRNRIEPVAGSATYGHLGHPVNFEGRERYRNKTALTRLGEAYRHAGVEEQHFYPEPVAAAVSFLHDRGGVEGKHLLTADFGGGTLDFCVLRRNPGAFEVVATHGIALGGDHIDRLLFRKLLFPLLGEGEIWRRRGMNREIETRFPFEDYAELLLNWPVSYTLNQNRYTTPVLDCIAGNGPATAKFRRLRDIIGLNLGYVVFQALKDLKAELSVARRAVLDVPELDVRVPLARPEFEALIAGLLDSFRQALDATLARARLAPRDIQIVLGTGGSILVPAVRGILEDRFPGRVVEHDPFTSVAAGLAIADYKGLRSR